MAEFPDGFDSRLIVWPEDDATHPFPDKQRDVEGKRICRDCDVSTMSALRRTAPRCVREWRKLLLIYKSRVPDAARHAVTRR
jgi:hypothetical protein